MSIRVLYDRNTNKRGKGRRIRASIHMRRADSIRPSGWGPGTVVR